MGVYTVEVSQRFEIVADDDYKAKQQAIVNAVQDARRGFINTGNANVVGKQETVPEARDFRVRITRWTKCDIYVRALLADDIYNVDENTLNEMYESEASYESNETIESVEEIDQDETDYTIWLDLTATKKEN